MKKTLFVIKTLLLAFLLLSLASIPGGFAMGFSSASNPGASTDTPVFLTITLIGEIIVPTYLLIYYRAKNIDFFFINYAFHIFDYLIYH